MTCIINGFEFTDCEDILDILQVTSDDNFCYVPRVPALSHNFVYGNILKNMNNILEQNKNANTKKIIDRNLKKIGVI